MKNYKDKEKEGVDAIIRHCCERITENLDQIHLERGDSYNDRSVIPKMRVSLEKFMERYNENEDITMLELFNKNPLLSFASGVFGEDVIANQRKINDFFDKIEDSGRNSMYDRGYGDSLILRALGRIDSAGLFGKGSAGEYLLSKVMSDFPFIVDALSSKNPQMLIVKMIGESIGITPDSMRDAYENNGLLGTDGLLYHVASALNSSQGDNIFELLKMKTQKALDERNVGFDLSGLDLDECLTSYRLHGFDGEQGVVNVALTSLIKNSKGFGGRIFSKYTERFMKENPEETRRLIIEDFGFVQEDNPLRSLAENIAFKSFEIEFGHDLAKQTRERAESKKYLDFASRTPPSSLKDYAFLRYVKDNGIIGANGVFAYLRDCMDEIMAPFAHRNLISQDEIEDIKEKYDEISRINELGNLYSAYTNLIRPTFDKGKKGFSFHLSELAESMGITPYELLSNPEYSESKKSWLSCHFGSFQECDAFTPDLERMLYSEDVIDFIEKSFCLDNDGSDILSKTGRSVVSYLRFKQSQNPNYEGRIRDYVRLVKDFIEIGERGRIQ